MIKVKYILFVTFILLSTVISAQQSLYTGQVDITIPITKIETDDFTLPIYLNYDHSGHKVDDIASNIGLGWSLFTGGEITRAVRGYPDDYYQYDDSNFGVGWISDFEITEGHEILGGLINWDYSDFYIDMAKVIQVYDPLYYTAFNTWKLLKKFDQYWLDSEPDLFTFKLPNGQTGKFYFDPERNIITEQQTNLIFDYELDSDDQLIEFTITDNKGIKYIYSTIDVQCVTIERDENFYFYYGYLGFPNKFSEINTTYNHKWHITTIITPKGDQINYAYENEIYILNPHKPEKKRGDETSKKQVYTELSISNNINRIKQIFTDNIEINFIKGYYQRDDLQGTYPISKIMIYWKPDNSFIKGFKLVNDDKFFIKNLSKRLKLVEIRSIVEDNPKLEKSLYKFHYNENEKLPARFSAEQDLWGYYNGSAVSGGISLEHGLIPKIHIYSHHNSGHDRFRVLPIPDYTGDDHYVIDGGDRTPDIRWVDGKLETVMDAYILEQIDYAEGGYTKYEYEPHEYYYDGAIYRGGGIRITKVTNSDGDSDNSDDIIKEYNYPDADYGTSGRLLHKPIYAFTYYKKNDANEEGLISEHYLNNNNSYFQKHIVVNSTNQAPYLDKPIVYKYVEVNNLNNGKKKYTYEVNSLFGDYTSEFKSLINNNLLQYLRIFPENPMAVECAIYYISPNPDFNRDSYPFPSNENCDWKRGQINRIEIFDQNSYPVKEIEYFYQNFSLYEEPYLYGFRYSIINNPVSSYDCYDNHNEAPRFQNGNPQYVYGRYKIATGVSRKLVEKEEKIYDQNDLTKYNLTTTTYEYNDLLQVKSINVTQSDGSEKITTYKYPTDYPEVKTNESSTFCEDDACTGINNLYRFNQISRPIETIQYIEKEDGSSNTITEITEGNIVKYKNKQLSYFICDPDETNCRNFIVVPYEVMKIETDQPIEINDISTFQSYINKTDGLFEYNDNYYKSIMQFDAYDEKGNILQYHKTNNGTEGKNISNIWGYDSKYIVAKAENARYDEIFFDGFEEFKPADPQNYSAQHSGLYCTRSSANSNKFVSVKDFDDLDFNKAYTLSVWLKIPSYYSGEVRLIIKSSPSGESFYTNKVIDAPTNDWEYFEHIVDFNDISGYTGPVRIEILNNSDDPVYVDDVRFHPTDALMTTYTYKPLIGMTSETAPNNVTTYYEYDALGRLIRIRDDDKNIVKQYTYHYANQDDLPEEDEADEEYNNISAIPSMLSFNYDDINNTEIRNVDVNSNFNWTLSYDSKNFTDDETWDITDYFLDIIELNDNNVIDQSKDYVKIACCPSYNPDETAREVYFELENENERTATITVQQAPLSMSSGSSGTGVSFSGLSLSHTVNSSSDYQLNPWKIEITAHNNNPIPVLIVFNWEMENYATLDFSDLEIVNVSIEDSKPFIYNYYDESDPHKIQFMVGENDEKTLTLKLIAPTSDDPDFAHDAPVGSVDVMYFDIIKIHTYVPGPTDTYNRIGSAGTGGGSVINSNWQ